jgi:tetratricopeptide (TPR) repeat protein
MWWCPMHSKNLLLLSFLLACSSSDADEFDELDPLQGTITYPFVETNPLGKNGPVEPIVIKSNVGDAEYAVSIPVNISEFEIELPIEELIKAAGEKNRDLKDIPPPMHADRQIVESFPQIEEKHPIKSRLVDRAFGVVENEKPKQPRSYLLGLSKINDLYKRRKFEYALIEIDNLLVEYPNSVKLYKMKGTVLIKLGNIRLAEKAWLKATDMAPDDTQIKRSLKKLRAQIETRYSSK